MRNKIYGRMATAWAPWLARSLARVRERDLLRVLRPILPTEGPASSPVKVCACAHQAHWRPRSPAPIFSQHSRCRMSPPLAPVSAVGPLSARLAAQVRVTSATRNAWMDAAAAENGPPVRDEGSACFEPCHDLTLFSTCAPVCPVLACPVLHFLRACAPEPTPPAVCFATSSIVLGSKRI